MSSSKFMPPIIISSTMKVLGSRLNGIFPRFNLKLALVLAGLVLTLIIAPRHSGKVAAEACVNPPTAPVFNPYPIVYDTDPGLACVDAPLVRAKLENGSYPSNQQEQDAGVTAHAGDVVDVLVYFHNGAISNGDPNITTAFNTRIITAIDTSAVADHQVRVALNANNAPSIHEKVFIHTNSNETLQMIRGSGQRLDFQGHLVQSGFNINANGEFTLGDLRACFEFSGLVKFKMRVVGPPIQQLTCAPANQTVDMNVPVTFHGAGGTAPWSWIVTGVNANPSGQIGSSLDFTTIFTGSGDATATLNSSGLALAQCHVHVNAPPPQQVGCIDVVKETFDTQGNPITPVAQFTFHLTNSGISIVNNSSGRARFSNLSPGAYIVFEDVPSTWVQLSITPANGLVQVSASSACATVVFKNRQLLNQATLECRPLSQTFLEGQRTVSFTAVGGNGQYSWTATSGNPSSGSGSSFTATFPGVANVTYSAVVTSGNQTVVCRVNFTTNPQPNPPVCGPNFQSGDINRQFFFSASGGNGVFAWTAPGGNPASGSSSSFSTTYAMSGQKTVTVSSNGMSDTCTVQVNQIFNQVVCSPHFQNVNVGQTAFFSASGGNGVFAWTAPGGNPASGSSSSFSAAYSTSGQKTVAVSSAGVSDTCIVQVNQFFNQVVCAPHFQSANANQTVFFSASGGNGSFSWSAPGGNPSTGFGSTFNTFYANSGTFTATVSSNGISDTCQVQVNQIINQVVCSPHFQNVLIGQNASFFASGGNGQFFWSAPGANVTSGSNSTFNTSYNNTGQFTVTVSSSGTTDTCTVQINQIFNNQVICSPHFQSANLGQAVFFSASGGNGQFFWSAPNGNPSTAFGSSFSTSFNSPGQFTVTVSSSGTSDTCVVQVNQIFNNPIVCFPHFQNINANQSVSFFASGGNGQFFWSAPNGNPSSGTGSSFSTSYANSGTFAVIVSGNGTSDSCIVSVGISNSNNPNLVFSKRAFNDTKNVDAATTPASREDYITYTLTISNTGSGSSNNFVITDDLFGVLPFADMVNNGGGTLSGNTISFPGVTIPAGSFVAKSFKVRVKFFLSAQQTFVMTNTYGNTVTITIPPIPGQPRIIAPKTGAGAGMAAVSFAGLLTSGFALMRRRGKKIIDLLWN